MADSLIYLSRSTVATLLRRLGMASLVTRVNQYRLARTRSQVAKHFLQGQGLEIGALHFPLPVPGNVSVRYIDNKPLDKISQHCPHGSSKQILKPDIIEDGFVLKSIPSGSEDFLIANHVLEHSVDPLGALCNWARVLRPGGAIFMTVPVASMCFDRNRSITTLEHLIEDYHLSTTGNSAALHARNKEHYLEWTTSSEAEASKLPNGPKLLSHEQQQERAIQLWKDSADIHFHVFSESSFKGLLNYFIKGLKQDVTIENYQVTGAEITAVLKKSS